MLLEYIDYFNDEKMTTEARIQRALASAGKRTTRPFVEILVPGDGEVPTAVGGLPVRAGDVKPGHVYIVLGRNHDGSQR